MLNLNSLAKSFSHALRGVVYVLKSERNIRIHFFTVVVVFLLMLFFKVNVIEAALLIIVLVNVIVLELFNTVVEKFADILKPRIHQYVKNIKDIMAAAVLIGSIGALLVGVLIFFPYFWGFIR